MVIVIIWGWWLFIPVRVRRPVLGLLVAILFGLAVWLPYTVVAREYTPRPLLTEAGLPPDLTRLNLIYNGDMKLIGAKIGVDQIKPGERLPVMIYWQALRPMTINYSVFIHLIGRGHQNVGQLNTYPGLGLQPTTILEPGQIVVDTYPVLVDGGSEAPTRLLVNAGLFDFDELGRPGIQPTNSDGDPASFTIGQFKLIPVKWPPATDSPALAEFADNIRLVDYDLQACTSADQSCTVILKWQAQARPKADYTVFIQLWHNGEQISGFDSPPLGNDYPTSLWSAGEVILDPHQLDLSPLPPGQYRVLAGLYNFATGDRLRASANDKPLPDYAVDLGIISINLE
jgi:hypothetical protein